MSTLARRLSFALLVLAMGCEEPIPYAPPSDAFFDDWRRLGEIENHLFALADSPDATLIEVGSSFEGRPIWGIEIGTSEDAPVFLVNALQHAREWVSGSSAMFIADRLVRGVGVDPEVDEILTDWRVLVVPVVNPDGFEATWSTDRLWRKNRRTFGSSEPSGVDLNRNWGEGWGLDPGSSSDVASETYRGEAPFSEPETVALRDLVRDRTEIAAHIDLHSFGQLVLYPWGYTDDAPDGVNDLEALTVEMANAMEGVLGEPHVAGQIATDLYLISGGASDWMYAQGIPSLLVELRDRGDDGFELRRGQLRPTAREAWAGLVAFARDPIVQ